MVAKNEKKNVAIFLYEGFQIIDFTGPFEVLSYTFNVYAVGEKNQPFRASGGMLAMPNYTFDDFPKPDILVIPGGAAAKQAENPKVLKWIQDTAKNVDVVLSVCTGAELLAKAGLLDGLEITGNAGGLSILHKLAPTAKIMPDKRVVDAGKIVTCGGLSAGIDGALHLVEKVYGNAMARMVSRAIEYDWHPESTYAPALLADKYVIYPFGALLLGEMGGKPVRFENGTSQCEVKARISQAGSPAEAMDKINNWLSAKTKWIRKQTEASENNLTSQWQFVDSQGRNWSGFAQVEPTSEGTGALVATLRVTLLGLPR